MNSRPPPLVQKLVPWLACLGLGCASHDERADEQPFLAETEASIVTRSLAPGAVFPKPAPDAFYTFGTGAVCRNGSGLAGVTVRHSSTGSNKLAIYFQGGSACFNAFTCLSNDLLAPSSIDDAHKAIPSQGIFNAASGSAILDWNIVYVPYCTGDLHLGTRTGTVSGVAGTQSFFGRKNLTVFMQSILATFPNPTQILVAGESAGGAGALGNAVYIKNQYKARGVDPKVSLLDDSGPFLSAGASYATDYMPQCAQDLWRSLWGLDASVIADCGASCKSGGSVVPNVISRIAQWTGDTLSAQDATGRYKPGLVVSYGDAFLGVLFGQAKQLCRIGGEWDYAMQPALDDLRTRVGSSIRTYYIDSSQHTWTNHDYMAPVTQNVVGQNTGVGLQAFINRLVLGPAPAAQVGPGPSAY
jgi:hypothetical protein